MIHAWCHERRAARTFRLDRISEMHDPGTGEVYEAQAEIFSFIEKISHVSPEDETERAIRQNRHALNVLAYLARCDGAYHPDEQDIIAHYMADMCYERNIDGEAILRHVRRLCPTADIFHSSCAALAKSKDINRFLRYAIQLIEADGIIDDREFDAFHEIEETKGTTPRRGQCHPESKESGTLDFFSFQKVFAIDFETANRSRNSAIALGLATIDAEKGEVIETRSWLIRPPRLVFNPDFIEIHGIRPEDVASQPTFRDLWPEIEPLLDDAWLVAHNASFDRSVLEGTAAHYGIVLPQMHWLCTLKISRERWPDLPRHRLDTVCAHLGIPLNHHEAASDAEACGKVWLAAA